MPEDRPRLLEGRRAFVIGAASGIGEAAALRFAMDGAQVAIGDIDTEHGPQVASAVAALGGGAHFFETDITDPDIVRRQTDAAAEALGGLDILVATPMGGAHTPDILSITPEDWRREIDIMASGTLYAFQAAIPHLRKAGGGALIATTSAHFPDFGVVSHPATVPAYAAAKGAVEVLVRATARLHSRENIRVNAVQPGFTATRGILARRSVEEVTERFAGGMPLGVAGPEDVAEGYAFLASDYAAAITGYSLPVDGGALASLFGRLAL